MAHKRTCQSDASSTRFPWRVGSLGVMMLAVTCTAPRVLHLYKLARYSRQREHDCSLHCRPHLLALQNCSLSFCNHNGLQYRVCGVVVQRGRRTICFSLDSSCFGQETARLPLSLCFLSQVRNLIESLSASYGDFIIECHNLLHFWQAKNKEPCDSTWWGLLQATSQ